MGSNDRFLPNNDINPNYDQSKPQTDLSDGDENFNPESNPKGDRKTLPADNSDDRRDVRASDMTDDELRQAKRRELASPENTDREDFAAFAEFILRKYYHEEWLDFAAARKTERERKERDGDKRAA